MVRKRQFYMSGVVMIVAIIVIIYSTFFTPQEDERALILQHFIYPVVLVAPFNDDGVGLSIRLNEKQMEQSAYYQVIKEKDLVNLLGQKFIVSIVNIRDANGQRITEEHPGDKEKAEAILAKYSEPFYRSYQLSSRDYFILAIEVKGGLEIMVLPTTADHQKLFDEMTNEVGSEE